MLEGFEVLYILLSRSMHNYVHTDRFVQELRSKRGDGRLFAIWAYFREGTVYSHAVAAITT